MNFFHVVSNKYKTLGLGEEKKNKNKNMFAETQLTLINVNSSLLCLHTSVSVILNIVVYLSASKA